MELKIEFKKHDRIKDLYFVSVFVKGRLFLSGVFYKNELEELGFKINKKYVGELTENEF